MRKAWDTKEQFSDSEDEIGAEIETDNARESFHNQSNSSYDNCNQYKVLCLIKQTPEGVLEVHEDSIQILVLNDRPVAFICIMGQSYSLYGQLANQICEIKGEGFLCESVRGNEGIWMYSKPYYNTKTDVTVYYILGKQTEEDTLNPKIFSLLTLISSRLLYCTNKNLNKNSLNTLRSTHDLSEHIIVSSKSNQMQLVTLMPTLSWILKESTLNSSTSKNSIEEYLNQNQDQVKKSVKAMFPHREVLHLDSSNEHSSQVRYQREVGALKRKILMRTSAKNLKGHEIQNGVKVTILLEKLTASINVKGLIPLAQVWEQINDMAAKESYLAGIHIFTQLYKDNFQNQEPKGEQLQDLVKDMRSQAMEQFDKSAGGQNYESERGKLSRFLDDRIQSIRQANNGVCQIHNLNILKNISDQVAENIKSHSYRNVDQLNEVMDTYVMQYNEKAKGPNKQKLLTEFMTNFRDFFVNMLRVDQAQGEKSIQQVRFQVDQADVAYSPGKPTQMQSPIQNHNLSGTVKIKSLQKEVQELKQQLETKQLRNSLLQQKERQRLELQNLNIQKQIVSLNNSKKKGSTHKCCLLF